MKKWIALALVALLALCGYVAAGPYLAIHGIRNALAEQDMGKLERHVDFAAVRVNLRAQTEDWLARKAGPDVQSNPFGAFALGIANELASTGIDTIATPTGIAAILQGRSMWKQLVRDTVDGDTYSKPRPDDPLKNAETRYESLSRFTASATDADGRTTVFVFARNGLRWKLTDIRLPQLNAP